MSDVDLVLGFFGVVTFAVVVVAIRDSLAKRSASRGWKRGR